MRIAAVMEQTLGHVTHYRNLSAAWAERPDVRASWLPVPFEPGRVGGLVPLFRANWSVRASWRARRALGTLLARESVDALFFHTQVASLFSVDLMRRIPTVVSLDATPVNYDSMGVYYRHAPAGTGFVDRQKFLMNRRALHTAAALVTWSAWAKQSCVDDYGVPADRVHVLAPGAAPAYLDVGRRRLAASSDLPLSHGREGAVGMQGPHGRVVPGGEGRPVRLLFVGGDFARKGGPLLLGALRRPLGAAWELHVVTQQPVAAMPGVVVHHGVGPNSPELLRLFEESDLFVLPSLGECLSVVLMEAAAAALPVIATRVGALAEAVRTGADGEGDGDESGLIVPPGDVDALHGALAALVADPARRARMGRVGHDLARRRFDARRNADALLDVIGERAASAQTHQHQGRRHGRPGRAA